MATAMCKYCGGVIEWSDADGRWVANELDGNRHNCPEYKKAPAIASSRGRGGRTAYAPAPATTDTLQIELLSRIADTLDRIAEKLEG